MQLPSLRPIRLNLRAPSPAWPPRSTCRKSLKDSDFWRQSAGPRWGCGVRRGSHMMRFLLPQDNHDTLLEVQRSQVLEKAAISIQRVLRGYKYRCQPCPNPPPSPHTCPSCVLERPVALKPGTHVPAGPSLGITEAQDLSGPPHQRILIHYLNVYVCVGGGWAIHYISKSQMKCQLWSQLYFYVLLQLI